MKSKLSLFLIVVALLSGTYWYMTKQNNTTPQAAGFGQPGPTAVTSMVVKSESVMMHMNVPGRTSAYRQSQVRPQVTGIIKERLFEEGAYVEKGQQLYQLDDAQYEANLKKAKANLLSAKANYKTTLAKFNRIKSLIEKQAVSQQDLDDVEAQLDQAKADISVAEAAVALEQINVDYTHVYAPISGKIGKSNLTEGALVTASQSQALAVITQLDPIYVDMQISGEEAAMIQKQVNTESDIKVTLVEEQRDKKPISGVLEFIDVNVEESTGSVGLRAVFENKENMLLPGLFVNTDILLGQQNAILVPQRATTRTTTGDLSVWVVDDKKQVSSRIIEVNGAKADQWIVTSGLQDGDEIVVAGYQRLAPGATVTTTPWQQADVAESSRG